MESIGTIIQSQLSIERTVMANKRTMMAYFRSAVALVVAAAGLMKFIQDPIWIVIGVFFLILAPVMIVMGIIDYISVKKLIEKEKLFINRVNDTIDEQDTCDNE